MTEDLFENILPSRDLCHHKCQKHMPKQTSHSLNSLFAVELLETEDINSGFMSS